jgi:hypothetical protein
MTRSALKSSRQGQAKTVGEVAAVVVMLTSGNPVAQGV